MQKMTTLGLGERLESVLAYLFMFFSGFVLFFLEKNRTVRWHAMQSMLTFGTLSVLMFGVSIMNAFLSSLPFIGQILGFGLGLLFNILWWATIILWIWLMIMAWTRPNYRLPFVSQWVRYFV
jgi:uncharacterized membrane protein